MPEIVIDFGPDGSVVVDGQGFAGKACDEAMAPFEKALGKVSNRKNKTEYLRAEVKHGSKVRA